MTVKLFGALALIAAFAIPANAGTKIDDPVAFLRNAYAKWAASQPYGVGEDIYTVRLAALVALDRREANGEVPRADDFDFWCNCQDGEIKNPRVSGLAVDKAPERHVVTAKFDIDNRKETILFYFERVRDEWKLDDVQDLGPEGWTLSLLCKYGWPDGR
jgi:hypothetical protein